MVYCEIEGITFPVGNFAFIFEKTRSEELFDLFFDAEKNIKRDFLDCVHKLRMAFEAMALHEEAMSRSLLPGYQGKHISQIKEEVINEIKMPASTTNYKNILIEHCRNRSRDFAEVLLRYGFIRYIPNDDELNRKTAQFIRYLYAFGSESSHTNVQVDPKYAPTKENCFKAIKSFHDFLCVYYHCEKKYDHSLIPIGNYIAVPSEVTEKLGLCLDSGRYLYVRERKNGVVYYILSNDSANISDYQRRDIETIAKLWDDNYEDPANVIRLTDTISSTNSDYRYQVYALPGKPMKITNGLLNQLSESDKLGIIKGLCRGVHTIHSYSPQLYHRNISPDAFYVFKIGNKYKPLLARFDCIKDTASDQFTVLANVENRINNRKTNTFFAPELLKCEIGSKTDWEKADIFSLAKTCVYILTGSMDQDDCVEHAIDRLQVSDDIKLILIEMLDEQPDNRPAVVKLLELLD